MNSRELKNENGNAVSYGPPLFSTQIQKGNIKKRKKAITYKLEMFFHHAIIELLQKELCNEIRRIQK